MLVTKDVNIPLFDLITCLSDVIDLVNPELVNHHSKVAYIAYSIGTQLDLSRTERNELLLAGKLHDIGALSCQERMNTLRFELNNPRRHAEMGGELLKGFAPLSRVAELIRFHHVHWDGGNGKTVCGEPVPIGSHVLHLADRLAVLIGNRRDILKGTDAITRLVADQSGGMFMPELVDAFLKLSKKEYFWLDVISPSIGALLRRRVSLGTIDLNLDGLISLGQVFAKIIDFRSRFTATHSSGVAASASTLARIAGCSERECQMMKVAGFLHDMGKLAIPTEILEKPGKLSADERKTVSCHPFYTYRTLEGINDLTLINAWASFHHESLDGSGYPFRLHGCDLSLGSRIMAVVDVFTALTEDRPYREGMTLEAAMGILAGKVKENALDGNLVALLERNVTEINNIRESAQAESTKEYTSLYSYLGGLA